MDIEKINIVFNNEKNHPGYQHGRPNQWDAHTAQKVNTIAAVGSNEFQRVLDTSHCFSQLLPTDDVWVQGGRKCRRLPNNDGVWRLIAD